MSWPTKPLGAVAKIDRRGVSPASIKPGALYVGLENIERGGGLTGVIPTVHGQLASTKFQFDARHVLFGKLRPNLGKIARPAFEGICSTDILPLHPGPRLNRDYLAHFLSLPNTIALASSRATGINLPRLSPTELQKFEIPLPPIEEQRRIAEILDRADALRAKRREALAHLDDLTQSIFLDMFGDPMADSRKWARRLVGELAKVITGNTPSRSNEDNFGHDIEWIKSDNIGHGIHVTHASEGLSHKGRQLGRVVGAGAILVTCIAGSPNSIGSASIVDREVAFNQQINAIVPHSADSRFIWGQLRSCRRLVQEKSTGGMKGLVSKSQLQRVLLLDPPLALQHEFGARLSQLESTRESASAQSDEFDTLFASLQERVFAGQL